MIYTNIEDFAKVLLPNKRLLALDVAVKTVGLALSDVNKLISSPYSVLIRKNIIKDIHALNQIIIDKEVTGVIAGLPKQMDGFEGNACIMVRSFIDKLDNFLEIPIFFQDERLTTSAAIRILKEAKIPRKNRGTLDDKIAASYILQTVLEQINLVGYND